MVLVQVGLQFPAPGRPRRRALVGLLLVAAGAAGEGEDDDFLAVQALKSACVPLALVGCELWIHGSANEGLGQEIKILGRGAFHPGLR